jgi:putative transposase
LVKREFHENKRIAGSVKITENLSTPESPVNRKLVAKIMKENGLKSKVVKKYKATTNSNHNMPVAENILNRDFEAQKPNQKWVSDITYVPTDEGWLYLAGILDLCGREIAGWAMGERMTKELVIRCLNQARGRRGHPKEVLIHSDMGSQYCSNDYQQLLARHNFTCSMSRKGNCWDNSPMESFWGKLKQEWLNDKHFRTREEAKAAIFWYIEVYYRRKRLHATNDYKTPEKYTALAANF